jgi:hypothetical protein
MSFIYNYQLLMPLPSQITPESLVSIIVGSSESRRFADAVFSDPGQKAGGHQVQEPR